ncbi:MAG: hypothetical protein HY796_06530 [Elusimicrobia bacterium]|nr:hypothetical protein [Elusimicrobiota bacterium]
MNANEAAQMCARAEESFKKLNGCPLDRILDVFGKMGEKWADPKYHLRKLALEQLPEETGFSTEMIELGLKELCWLFDPRVLRKKIATELKGIPRTGSGFYDHSTQTEFKWRPLGTALHVLSGNVFLVAAGSLVEGLLTGNSTILKPSSSEKIFPKLLLQSLKGCDEEGIVSGSVQLADYSASQAEVIAQFKKRVDAIVIWGGEEAVKAYREGLSARTRLVVFGPKLSLAVATKEGLKTQGLKLTAQRLARDISVWDQNACTAPQACFVEGTAGAGLLAGALAASMKEISRKLPPGRPDPDTAAEIRKLRTVFEIAQTRKEALLLESEKDLDWTIVVDKNMATFEPSPLHRTIKIIPFENFDEVIAQLERLRGYIQTVGLAVSPGERKEITARLENSGALRIVEAGSMALGNIDDPHDGSYDLPQLMNLVFTRVALPEGLEPGDVLDPEERTGLINSRFKELIRTARASSYYSKIFKGLKIETIADLGKLPVLTREKMEANMPPRGYGLYTGDLKEKLKSSLSPFPGAITGGYVTRSGGSTGLPKFSIYDGRDWEEMISHAVRVLRAAGLRAGDRLANCFMAGELYGGFVSFDHINCRLGATTFAFAGDSRPELFAQVWKKFSINAIEGVPSTILPLLRKAKELQPALTLEKVIFAGSPMSETDRGWLKSALKVKRVSSVIGANDGGQLAYQCPEMNGTFHHTADEFNYIEITDEKGHGVGDGTPGRILITSLLKFAFPLIRYDVGDLGRIVPGKCACGRTGRILEFLGKSGDEFSAGCLNLKYREFKNALKKFAFTELQAAVKNSVGGEILSLRLETPDFSSKTLKSAIYGGFLKNMPEIKNKLDSGGLYRLEIELHRPGSLPRTPGSRKVKNVSDER